MPKIFICYSRVDIRETIALDSLLRRKYGDDNVWLDTNVTGAMDWWQKILGQILNCDVFLYLLSNESVTSPFCQAQFTEAQRLGRPVVTIQVRDRTKIPSELSLIQYVDMTIGGINNQFSVENLYNSIDNVVNQPRQGRPNWKLPTPMPNVASLEEESEASHYHGGNTLTLPSKPTSSSPQVIQSTVLIGASGFIGAAIRSITGGLFGRKSAQNKVLVQFILYNPRQVNLGKKYGLYVYAYTPELEEDVTADVQKFTADLGTGTPKKRSGVKEASLNQGTKITVVPEWDGILIEPKSLTKQWDGKWVRFPFDFTVPDDYPYEEIHIRISIQVHGIEVSHIVSSSEITEQATTPFEAIKIYKSPLDIAKERADLIEQISYLYRQIFISYSHNDEVMALKRAAEIEKLLGDKVFIDVKSLRQGEDWEARLAKAIDESDIFHLLWSENSSKSQYCRYEWEYALKSKCPQTRCVGVIRPIYWQDPMPKPPEELKHLHFQKVELE